MVRPRSQSGLRNAWRNRSSSAADDAGKEDEQVDIRVQAELAPAVSAEREHRDRLRQRPGIGIELLDERVHAVRGTAHRVASAFTPTGGIRQFAASGIEPGGTRDPRLEARIVLGEIGFG